MLEIQRWTLHDGPGIRSLVFLKGCPLACRWCANPESLAPHAEMAYFRDRCIRSGRCSKLCPFGAITMTESGPVTDWSICRSRCYGGVGAPYARTRPCYSKAGRKMGEPLTVDEVMEEILKDYPLYKESGGGVTLSGGEPMNQLRFSLELLRACRASWVHTAMETSGVAPWAGYEQILPLVDFLFLDIKHIDPERHEEITGLDNSLILGNAPLMAEVMAAADRPMVVRIPIVPGLTDDEANIVGICDFVRASMPAVRTVELMPYHRLGRGKYATIGKEYTLFDLEPPSRDDVARLEVLVHRQGFTTRHA